MGELHTFWTKVNVLLFGRDSEKSVLSVSSKTCTHSYRSAMSGSTRVALRAGK